MRVVSFLAALVLGLASGASALAAPAVARVTVSIGPDLAKKVDDLGQRELDTLADELRTTIARRIPTDPNGGTLDLVLVDATPNRPTPQQLANKPGLSFESFGLGGATIEGAYVDAAGNRTPVAYRWWETDIRWARYGSIWRDAEVAFDRFADRLAHDRFTNRR